MAGFENQVLLATNVNFNPGNPPNSGQVTTDGQLLIGSTAAPNIRVGTLTSLDGSITWTVGAGTISGTVAAGTGVVKTINGLFPTAGNIDIVGTTNQVQIANAGSTVTLSTPTTFIAPGSSSSTTFMTVGTILNMPTPNAGLTQGVILWANSVRMHTFGSNNLFWGNGAGNSTLSSADNIGIGLNNLTALTNGSLNVGLGDNTLAALTTGGSNTALGTNALRVAVGNTQNTAVGAIALRNATSGNNNVAVGYNSLLNLVSGGSNVSLGQGSGTAYTGAESNNILVGNAVTGTIGESNVTRLGGTQTTCFIAGINGVAVSGNLVNINSNGQLGTTGGGGFTWTDVTGATQTIAIQNGYLTDRGAGVTYTLPATASIGDMFIIVGKLGLATITPNANQQLLMGSTSGTIGATGTAVSTNVGDSVTFVCTTSGASTVWRASSWVGSWTLS